MTSAELIAFYLPMHTATRLAEPLIAKCRTLNPAARLAAYGLYAPLNAEWLHERGVADVIGPEAEAGLVSLAKTQLPTPNSHTEFKTTGPYGLVRHPIYLGWFLMVFGVPVMTGTRLVFAIVSCAYLLIAIPLEERTLQRTTGGRYEDYMRLVRWKLVPGVY